MGVNPFSVGDFWTTSKTFLANNINFGGGRFSIPSWSLTLTIIVVGLIGLRYIIKTKTLEKKKW